MEPHSTIRNSDPRSWSHRPHCWSCWMGMVELLVIHSSLLKTPTLHFIHFSILFRCSDYDRKHTAFSGCLPTSPDRAAHGGTPLIAWLLQKVILIIIHRSFNTCRQQHMNRQQDNASSTTSMFTITLLEDPPQPTFNRFGTLHTSIPLTSTPTSLSFLACWIGLPITIQEPKPPFQSLNSEDWTTQQQLLHMPRFLDFSVHMALMLVCSYIASCM